MWWKFFPFINFENPLYFWVGKGWSRGSTSTPARMLKFHMVINISKRNGNSLGANSYKKYVYFVPPLMLIAHGGTPAI